jgi:hypothetical protein
MTNLGNDAMEVAALVTESAFPSSEFAEVARGFWTNVVIELEDDSSSRLGIDCDVKLQGEWCQLRKSGVDVEGVRRRFCRREGRGNVVSSGGGI